MELIQKIKNICERPNFFGANSSEDIYWFIKGYCIAEQKYSTFFNASVLIENFELFLSDKYKGEQPISNWGVSFRVLSRNNKESITLFTNIFNEFINKYNYGELQEEGGNDANRNMFILALTELLEDDKLENNVQLQALLLGYELGYIDSKKIDSDLDEYIENRIDFFRKILNELKLPLYLNAHFQLFSRFYPDTRKGVELYIKTVLFNLSKNNT